MVLSFYFLLRYKEEKDHSDLGFYYKALKETIRLGGDTDTNACIVGGLIGALVGLHRIPYYMIQ
jgi:ADP-ribosylglycohydrolase